jgi:hypothetical protein
MKVRRALVLCTLLLVACTGPQEQPAPAPAPQTASSATPQDSTAPAPQVVDEAEPEHGAGHALLWYIPNRISDVLDIVRLRLRVGLGFAISARVTELADVNMGGYSSIFLGIPGPRRERSFNWPFGFESLAGTEISVFDGTTSAGDGPNYGIAEVGLGVHLLIVGLDLGVDVWEAVDFVTGLVFIDPVADDI